MKSETRAYAIFRVKDGSKVGEIHDFSFVLDGYGYLQTHTKSGIYLLDKKLKIYRARISVLVAFGKLDFLLTDEDDIESDWRAKN